MEALALYCDEQSARGTMRLVPPTKLSPLRTLSKSRGVFEQLRQAIWNGDLPPGTPLRENHIAKELNVSQVPVREALLQLEHLGLVVRVPDRGTTVTKLTRTEIEQMTDVRRHLEEMAFLLAAEHLTPEVEAELKTHLKKMRLFVEQKDHFSVAEEDFAFHRTVWKASGNEVLQKTLEHLCVAVYAFVSLKRHAAGETMKSAVAEHKKLLGALLSKDRKTIITGISEHIRPAAVIPSNVDE
jgi:DNA-binding GntR family transcriptional regulator